MFSPTHVVVTVRQARELLLKSKSGVNDAYATIEFHKEKFATAPEKSNSPRWMTECMFALPSGGVFHNNVFVNVSIHNKRHGKLGLETDDLIGLSNISLSALNASDSRERVRWYKLVGKKKDSKKDRGEVEVAFKFITKNVPTFQLDKKSPKISKFLKTGRSWNGSSDKTRRKSEDEDSGVGLPIAERQESFTGKSCENLSVMRNNSTTSSSGTGSRNSLNKLQPGAVPSSPIQTPFNRSARGSRRNLSIGGFPGSSSRAISMEVLHNSSNRANSVADDSSIVRRSNSSGTKKEKASSKQQQSLVEATNRSQSVISLNRLDKQQQQQQHQQQNPMKAFKLNSDDGNDNSQQQQQQQQVSSVYKRGSFKMRDFKKVSTIPEDQKSSFETMPHDQLVSFVKRQQSLLKSKDEHIVELENYIDHLLLKVIVVQPQILENSARY